MRRAAQRGLGGAAVGLLCVCGCAAGSAQGARSKGAWEAAVAARKVFEAAPDGLHTRAEYSATMDGFRGIYHGDPQDRHAAEAVAQVAELLVEEGREFHDPHELTEGAGQYEYLAKAYPDSGLAPVALGKALALYGADGVGDVALAERVRQELLNDYPRSGEARAVPLAALPEHGLAGGGDVDLPAGAALGQAAPIVRTRPEQAAVVSREAVASGPPATLSSIRHWSTSDYTRVAIDLGADVRYEAARVENPDRIFFDIHHAQLGAGLAGKSFVVTDDGFLTRIRAAQFSPDTVRVVLDVHEVAEFSAFLLPSPYRLIIDIHGRQVPERQAAVDPAAGVQEWRPGAVASAGKDGRVAASSLPPMPVTDGSTAGFGLPMKRAGGSTAVAVPRVVIPSKPTQAKPVPNTVTTSAANASGDVAAVSSQSGKVEATRRPTSRPVVEKSTERTADGGQRAGSSGEKAGGQWAADSQQRTASGDAIVNVMPGRPRGAAGSSAAPAPPLSADGQTSLLRALGLKIGRIVIDAGHGGHDSGTLGADGIQEKDVVLDVALRLGKLLQDRLGAEIVYTRADDTFIPLETRTAIANKAQADLFISIHANSSESETARGVEVYYLNFTSDPDAMKVAARENAVSSESVHDLSDLVKKIALKDKIDESRELATDVDASLFDGLTRGNAGLKDRGVKKAPFVVLIGANMPSILAEISFVTNPQDAAELRTPAYRERVAESLYKGVAQYASAINGTPKRVKAGRVERTSLSGAR